MTRAETVGLSSRHKPVMQRRFAVRRLARFGSRARDDARPDGDIDILVEFDGVATSARYFGLQFFLEDLPQALQILPGQIQAFRGAVARHSRAGDADRGGISYNDLVSAEQTLVQVATTYLGILRDQWQAVVDLGGLLQTYDLFDQP